MRTIRDMAEFLRFNQILLANENAFAGPLFDTSMNLIECDAEFVSSLPIPSDQDITNEMTRLANAKYRHRHSKFITLQRARVNLEHKLYEFIQHHPSHFARDLSEERYMQFLHRCQDLGCMLPAYLEWVKFHCFMERNKSYGCYMQATLELDLYQSLRRVNPSEEYAWSYMCYQMWQLEQQDGRMASLYEDDEVFALLEEKEKKEDAFLASIKRPIKKEEVKEEELPPKKNKVALPSPQELFSLAPVAAPVPSQKVYTIEEYAAELQPEIDADLDRLGLLGKRTRSLLPGYDINAPSAPSRRGRPRRVPVSPEAERVPCVLGASQVPRFSALPSFFDRKELSDFAKEVRENGREMLLDTPKPVWPVWYPSSHDIKEMKAAIKDKKQADRFLVGCARAAGVPLQKRE